MSISISVKHKHKSYSLDIPADIIYNFLKKQPDAIYKLNEIIDIFVSQYKTITNVKILRKCRQIYSFRNDDIKYCCNRPYLIRVHGYKLCMIIEYSKCIQGSKLTFIYNNAGYNAERSPVLPQLVDLIMQDQGLTKQNIDANYIGLSLDPALDLPKFKNATSRGYNVYVSALGTNIVSYLSSLYFNTAPQGVYHVNCYSTAVTLFGLPNLIRVFPPDSFTPPIFVKLSSNNIVLLYITTSIWSSSLARGIIDIGTSQGKNVISIPISDPLDPNQYLPQLSAIPGSTEPHTVIILSDLTMLIVDNIRVSGVLDDKFPYQLLFGDATADSPVTSEALLLYLQVHDTLLLQPFITNSDLALAKRLNLELNDPEHPVTQNIGFFYGSIDMAILLREMPLHKRIKRKRFVLLELDNNYNNANGYYSGVQYTGLTTYNLYLIAFVNATQLFIGTSS